jgi:hypothetical protein
MWKILLKSISELLTPMNMSKKSSEEIIFYSTSNGRVFIKPEEFLQTTRVKKMIKRLLTSKLYRDIKSKQKMATD